MLKGRNDIGDIGTRAIGIGLRDNNTLQKLYLGNWQIII